MTRTRSHKAKITVTTHRNKIRPRVRWRWLDVDGMAAVVVIAIILAARLIDVIIAVTWPIVTSLAARFARGSVRLALGLWLFLRAFYIP